MASRIKIVMAATALAGTLLVGSGARTLATPLTSGASAVKDAVANDVVDVQWRGPGWGWRRGWAMGPRWGWGGPGRVW